MGTATHDQGRPRREAAAIALLAAQLGQEAVTQEDACDGVPTAWISPAHLVEALQLLKNAADHPYPMLYDLACVDETARVGGSRSGGAFTAIYHLLDPARDSDIRLKVPLCADAPTLPTATSVWPAAGWYEREAWDMFGVSFEGHPDLRRILLPPTWQGHPLLKSHPARATELPPWTLTPAAEVAEQEALRFTPRRWGGDTSYRQGEVLTLNLGPQHPGTHGVLRLVLHLDGEVIRDVEPDIGFHHRGAEKMAERQSWHTFIPYTDRIDYLAGVLNNLPYVMAVENLCGITVPDRAVLMRVMLCELFRVASHLVWYGTFAQDVGALSPVFYMFTDRERVFDVVEAVCGGRMHPNWFRIGGVAQDLPRGWRELVGDLLPYLRRRLREYDRMVMQNAIFRHRTRGIGAITAREALEWGVTGPMLRACGVGWDLRRARPYCGYDQLTFEVPTAAAGDCYARAEVRVEEMRQSLSLVEQCAANMPDGEHKARHVLATPPLRDATMHDIETLITHFLGVSWGPVVPPGECMAMVESAKGVAGYFVISDGDTRPYRVRIRAPSFPHMQALPLMSRGHMLADLLAILGSIDFVLADVDR